MNQLDQTFLVVSRVLDFTAAKSNVLAKNLANASTPGYRRLEVDFEQLINAMRHKHEDQRVRALGSLQPQTMEDPNSPPDSTGNNVVAETELAELQRMALTHEMATQMASGKLQTLRRAINGS